MLNWNKGKSPHKFSFTYKDIAVLTGLSIHTIRIYASKHIFNPNDLLSLYKFASPYIQNGD